MMLRIRSPFTIRHLLLIGNFSLIIVNSLKIDNCKLIIASKGAFDA